MATRGNVSNQRALNLRKTMTAAEVALWQMLRRGRLGVRFQRQVAVGPFIVDFLCRSHRVVVELDGGAHFDPYNDYDVARDEFLRRRGYLVLRFENLDLAEEPDEVIGAITAALSVTGA